jgi:purine-binding chemotaxis protein CheW
MQYIVFLLDEQQFGLALPSVERILSMVEVTPLPNAPAYFLGAIDIHGEIVPVVNMRKLLGIQEKEIAITDHLLLCHFHGELIALWTDRVSRMINGLPTSDQDKENLVCAKMKGVKQVIEEKGRLIFIIQPDQLIPSITQFARGNGI